MVQTKVILSLYKGLSTLVAGSIPKAGIRFASFEFFKKMLSDDKGNLPSSKTMLCGLLAGFSEAIFAGII
jgi:solute carrier family 25 (mitochondrial citrate transporter), member 1